MITIQDVKRFEADVAALPRPVLSLYMDVRPSGPRFDPRAVASRARSTLRDHDVPDEVARRALARIEAGTEPGRTLALFATRDEVRTLALQVSLPVRDPATGLATVRFGEPYLLPLELALDEYQRYGVVFIDREHWRFFDAFLGDFEEVVDAFRPLQSDDFRRYDEARRQHPAYTATRSDSDRDELDRAVAEWTHRFHKRAGKLLDDQVAEREIERLVLMGPPAQVRDYRAVLPRRLRDRVVAELPSLTSPTASPGEVRKRVDEAVHDIERAQEAQLLGEIRERGVRGLAPSLAALQEGRVYVLAAPWNLEATVYRDEESGYVAADGETARKHSTKPTPDVRVVELRDVILDLTSAYGTRVDFVRNANEELLREELGGMGGLTRW